MIIFQTSHRFVRLSYAKSHFSLLCKLLVKAIASVLLAVVLLCPSADAAEPNVDCYRTAQRWVSIEKGKSHYWRGNKGKKGTSIFHSRWDTKVTTTLRGPSHQGSVYKYRVDKKGHNDHLTGMIGYPQSFKIRNLDQDESTETVSLPPVIAILSSKNNFTDGVPDKDNHKLRADDTSNLPTMASTPAMNCDLVETYSSGGTYPDEVASWDLSGSRSTIASADFSYTIIGGRSDTNYTVEITVSGTEVLGSGDTEANQMPRSDSRSYLEIVDGEEGDHEVTVQPLFTCFTYWVTARVISSSPK